MDYSDIVLDHFQHPRNVAVVADANVVGRADVNGQAPRISLYIKVSEQRIEAICFRCFGCGAAIASCSLLTEVVAGKPLDDCAGITPQELLARLGGLPRGKEFCAELAVAALHDGLRQARAIGSPKTPSD